MRNLLAVLAASFVLVGCGAGGSSDETSEPSCETQTVVTKTGVVETCV